MRSSANEDGVKLVDWNVEKSEKENVVAILTNLKGKSLFENYGRIVGALAKNLDFEAMKAYADGCEAKGYIDFGGYHDGYDYEKCATYCAKFARAVGYAGGIDWKFNTLYGEGNVDDIVERDKTEKIEIP